MSKNKSIIMPSSTEYLRKKFMEPSPTGKGYVNDGIKKAEQIILRAGGTIQGEGWIDLSKVDFDLWMHTDDLADAVEFLRWEWDYGIVAYPKPPHRVATWIKVLIVMILLLIIVMWLNGCVMS